MRAPTVQQKRVRQKRGARAQHAGLIHETLACLLLLVKGYRILHTRLRTPAGEVDILATRGHTLVIVEVKKRTSDAAASAAISATQQHRLRAAANHVAAQYGTHKTLRFDAVLFANGHVPRHIENAF